jgi:hypothetical protein
LQSITSPDDPLWVTIGLVGRVSRASRAARAPQQADMLGPPTATAQRLEVREPVGPDHHCLTVNDEAVGFEKRCASGDGGEPPTPIDRIAAVEPDVVALFADDHPITIMLDLVNPLSPGRRLFTLKRLGRRNKTRRERTLQHRSIDS